MTPNEQTMMYTEAIRGYPYLKKEGIAQEFHVSKGTVTNRVHEIEEEMRKGRYSEYSLIQDGNILLINVLVFIDFMTYRKRLLNKNLRKNVPPYCPEKIVREVGWSNRAVYEQ